MVFSSLTFLFIFFPLVFLLYWVCRNIHVRNVLLVIASLIFYAYGEPVAIIIMLISVLFNFVFGIMCSNGARDGDSDKKTLLNRFGLIAAVILNIGLLIVFKYSSFLLNTVGLAKYDPGLKLPIGISFFTFQGLSYVVDVYRDKKCVQKNLLSLTLYISFFPQLIAGPIVKYHDIREQLVKREFKLDNVADGLQRFVFGLGKKVLIAGPMGLMVDTVYAMDVAGVGRLTSWIVAISYMFQIYFDFSGYSDMAIGLGQVFGFTFKENFNKPYAATNLQQFWRKWHISLSTWFKEYVYIPLGGNRKGTVRTYINKFIVFLLTGLWHGANWTFVCWGLLHGIGLILEDIIHRLGQKNFEKLPKPVAGICRIFGVIITCFFVMVAFVLFRADDLSVAGMMIKKLFVGVGNDAEALALMTPMYLIALALAVIFASTLPDKLVKKINNGVIKGFSVIVYVLCIVMLISGGYNPFIYFRF